MTSISSMKRFKGYSNGHKRYTVDWSRFYQFNVGHKAFVKDTLLDKVFLVKNGVHEVVNVWVEIGDLGIDKE